MPLHQAIHLTRGAAFGDDDQFLDRHLARKLGVDADMRALDKPTYGRIAETRI